MALPLQVLIFLAIVLPAAAIAAPVGQGVRIAALVVDALLLVVVRMMAGRSLNELHIGLLVPALYILVVSGLYTTMVRRTQGS